MDTGEWRRASLSTVTGANCVEARMNAGGPEVRDSKLGDESPLLRLSPRDFAALLHSVARDV